MKSGLLTLSICLLSWQASMPVALAAGPDLVLVSSSKSTIGPLPEDEVRKLYLGITILADGQPIKPLRNHSDSYVQQVFMRKVMFMSTQAYERQILSQVFRMGGNRPPIFTGVHKLISALKADPSTVTYMYSDEASAHPDLRILGILWEDTD